MSEPLKQRLEREVIDWKEKYDAERIRADRLGTAVSYWRRKAEYYKTEADQAHARINKMFVSLYEFRELLMPFRTYELRDHMRAWPKWLEKVDRALGRR